MSYQNSQQNQPYYHQQAPVQHIHYHQAPAKSSGVAVALELAPGFFFQTFGIGHLYAGKIGLGLFFMFGYWFLLFINILLMFILIGLITMPLCWVAMMIISPISAASAASKARY